MKKKFFTSIAVTFVMAAALVAVAPTSAQAAKAINVTVGAKVTVKANKKVTWSVKDTSIATINKKSGKKVKLTGVKEGSTVLTTTDASGKTLDYAVNVKAAAAPAATNKLQEFANYVKSKGKVEYNRSVSASNNWEILKKANYGWIYAGEIKLSDGNKYKVVYRPGQKNSDHDFKQVYTITADANNLYFKRTVKFQEMDWRYINWVNDHKASDPSDVPAYAKGNPAFANWKPEEFNEARYYIFGTTRDIENFIVTIPLNGGAAKAEFAHNFDYDFVRGAGKNFPSDFAINDYSWKAGDSTSNAIYSHWVYDFYKEKYLTNAAYSWTVDKDGHDYLSNTLLRRLGTADIWNQMNTYEDGSLIGPNVSVWLSKNLNSLLNTIDSIMKDNQTGFDLKSIGFDNFVNSAGHYYTNADAALAAVYTVAWQNIAFY